ncbi:MULTISPECIES: DUF1236 domain-containing protein [Bradyrhizobium]|uniref:DUF1236 domain-containing protein n=1 Tax=Bradyrhizobium elkanii TaxID=29448 RepID=A0A4U6RUI4_BRAEL|nr:MULTISPECIES: DUF1236 domain-containing protein [Bradyrhizobium]MTV19057.1 DUF1236 domain-containing protein [Bradyrhizobium sp. BR2003]TKV77878.1 DUF1236 domain-containing protein [Bradyrhizobium elkanii]
MNRLLLLATTAAAAIATSAFAQTSPSTSNANPPGAQRQQDSTSATTPSSSTTPSSTTSSGPAQGNATSTNSAQTQSSPSAAQSATGQLSQTGANTAQTPASGNSPSQAQTSQPSNQANPPSNQAQTNSPSTGQTQSANPPASNNSNQAQSPTGSSSTNTAQHPNSQRESADRSSNTNVNAAVNINDQQRTRISTSISHLNVQPLTNVNFSLSVGTAVPRDVRLQPLPAEVVEIVPQYRGYDFVLVKDEIVIVEPSSYKIVAVMPYSGRATAAAPARSEQRKTTFSDRDREVIRKHAKARPVERERRTTGSTARTEIRTGERVPDDVEIEAFPDEVYRDAPTLREYRYVHRDSRTYIVEPHERRIIEEID